MVYIVTTNRHIIYKTLRDFLPSKAHSLKLIHGTCICCFPIADCVAELVFQGCMYKTVLLYVSNGCKYKTAVIFQGCVYKTVLLFFRVVCARQCCYISGLYVQKKGKGSFSIAQYPVRWTAQSALHFLPPLADLFIPTPTRLLREAF